MQLTIHRLMISFRQLLSCGEIWQRVVLYHNDLPGDRTAKILTYTLKSKSDRYKFRVSFAWQSVEGTQGNMSVGKLLKEKREDILRIAAQHGASKVRIFGSVARGEDGPDSDLDLL